MMWREVKPGNMTNRLNSLSNRVLHDIWSKEESNLFLLYRQKSQIKVLSLDKPINILTLGHRSCYFNSFRVKRRRDLKSSDFVQRVLPFRGSVLSPSAVHVFTAIAANRATIQLQSCIWSFENVWKVKKDFICTRARPWPRPLKLPWVFFTQHFLWSDQPSWAVTANLRRRVTQCFST